MGCKVDFWCGNMLANVGRDEDLGILSEKVGGVISDIASICIPRRLFIVHLAEHPGHHIIPQLYIR